MKLVLRILKNCFNGKNWTVGILIGELNLGFVEQTRRERMELSIQERLKDLHLSDDMIELLKSGLVDNRWAYKFLLLSISHKKSATYFYRV